MTLQSGDDRSGSVQPHPGPHLQAGCLRPVRAARIIAVAQPTPLSTRIAPSGQFFAQAPHSMQEPRSARRASPSPFSNTPCGQTTAHIPQRVQRAGSYSSVLFPVAVNLSSSHAAHQPVRCVDDYTAYRHARHDGDVGEDLAADHAGRGERCGAREVQAQ